MFCSLTVKAWTRLHLHHLSLVLLAIRAGLLLSVAADLMPPSRLSGGYKLIFVPVHVGLKHVFNI